MSPFILSLIGQPLPETVVAGVAAEFGLTGQTWLADGTAFEATIRLDADKALQIIENLRARLAVHRVDVNLLDPRLPRQKKLLVADMDSTILVGESLDELAAFAGVQDVIAAITARAMNGEIDFATALKERVAMLKGLPVSAIDQTLAQMHLMPGAREFVQGMRANGAYTALVSGGFTPFTAAVRQQVGFDLDRANDLVIENGQLTGAVREPILDKNTKLATLKELAAAQGIDLTETLAIGDGANDLPMLQAAGLGIAFHAKPAVAAAARYRLDFSDLRGALYLQGLTG